MGEGNEKDRFFPVTGIVAVFAALGLIFFYQAPLKGARPSSEAVHEPGGKIEARLWQDPFRAVLEEKKRRSITAFAAAPLYSSRAQFTEFSEEKEKRKYPAAWSLEQEVKKRRSLGRRVSVVGVMAFGSPYAEEEEFRVRHRYAVLSGFRRLGFIPVDSDHIDFIRVCEVAEGRNACSQVFSDAGFGLREIMPFEWLQNAARGRDKEEILLLWMNDRLFRDQPLLRLSQVGAYAGAGSGGGSSAQRQVFKVIGPAGSTNLRAMLEELDQLTEVPSKPYDFEIFSPFATVDDARLLAGLTGGPSLTVEKRFEKHGVIYHRSICSDRQLAEAVIHELKLRGVNFKDSRQHMVLISEWDTLYGQSLPEIYGLALCNREGAGADRQLHKFSYLRGIDGKLPLEKEKPEPQARDGNDQQEEKGEAKRKEALEHPTGNGQFDYVRRLADEIYRLDQHLGSGSIRAIGVVGNDFYDKYLVLQALRQRFPQALFFTTDLDARLLHAEAFPSTHNLIVASSYNLGLRADDDLPIQGDVPPFRDNYQTALFLTVLQAFASDNHLEAKVADVVRQEPKPRVFEIGRYSAVDLTDSSTEARTIHPEPQARANNRKFFTKCIVIAGLLLGLLGFSSDQVRSVGRAACSGWRRRGIALTVFLFLGAVVGSFYYCVILHPEQEEPFFILEGVSAWPAELFRILATALSIWFIWWGYQNLEENAKELGRKFHLLPQEVPPEPEEEPVPVSGAAGIVGDLKRHLREFSHVVRYDWVPKGTPTMDDFWREYLRRNSSSNRMRRLIPMIATFLLLSGYLISFCRPVPPIRGAVTTALDRIYIATSVLTFDALFFYVFDVIRTCKRLVDLVSRESPTWRPESVRAFLGNSPDREGPTPGRPQTDFPLQEWMRIRFIADRTGAVGKLVFYPFVVWVLLFVSRLDYFDNWHTPVGLVIVITLGALFPWSCAVLLRRSAERAREISCQRLQALQVAFLSQSEQGRELERTRFVADAVATVRDGAFAPFMQNPVIQALMVPFGGVGGVYLMDVLGKLNI